MTAITRRSRAQNLARLTYRQADLTQPDALPERFDAIVHCAAETPARCPDSVALYASNVAAMQHVCEHALRAGAHTVLFTSSMSAYGTISVPVVNREYAIPGPRSVWPLEA